MSQSFLDTPGLPAGLRNNNPGNLRPLPNGQKWLGEIEPDTANNLSRFSDIAFGLRAMITSIVSAIVIHGRNTLSSLISHWAPSSDGNDPGGYAARVSDLTGIGINDPITVNADNIISIAKGMVNVEVGPGYADYISDDDYTEAVQRLSAQMAALLSIGGGGISAIATVPVMIAAGIAAYLIFK